MFDTMEWNPVWLYQFIYLKGRKFRGILISRMTEMVFFADDRNDFFRGNLISRINGFHKFREELKTAKISSFNKVLIV